MRVFWSVIEVALLCLILLLWRLTPLLFAGHHPAWRVLRVMLVAGAIVVLPWPILTRQSATWLAAIALLSVIAAVVLWRRAARLGGATVVREIVEWRSGDDATETMRGLSLLWILGSVFRGEDRRPPGMAFALIIASMVRAFGLWVLVLGFFAGWCVVWIAIWALDPDALTGLGSRPTIGDFFYLAVSGVFGSPPPDIIPTGSVGHAVLVMEVIAGAAAVTMFAAMVLAPGAKPTDGAAVTNGDEPPPDGAGTPSGRTAGEPRPKR